MKGGETVDEARETLRRAKLRLRFAPDYAREEIGEAAKAVREAEEALRKAEHDHIMTSPVPEATDLDRCCARAVLRLAPKGYPTKYRWVCPHGFWPA